MFQDLTRQAADPAPYSADRSFAGKLRRRLARFDSPRRVRFALDRPVVSFTFDDAPKSAAVEGARLLEAVGARATYYVAAGLCGTTGPSGLMMGEADIQRLVATGHEIGCHSFGHLDCARVDPDQLGEDVERNQAVLKALGVPEPSSFAFPFGEVSSAARRTLSSRFRAMRALHRGTNAVSADLNRLPAVGVEGPDGEARAARWLDRAARNKAWLILYSHDVDDRPSAWGCTPYGLGRLIGRAQALGFEILTVGQALDRIGAPA